MRASESPTADAGVRRLSFAQEQLWFLDQLAPHRTTYNVLMVWRLRGPLRVDLLRRTLNLVVARHESLRVTIDEADGTPYQRVAPAGEVPLPVTDLRALPEAEVEQRLQAEIDARRAEPYDLRIGPLIRFRLLRLGEEDHVLCQGYHHIVTDGWSIALVNAELSAAYRALYAGIEPVFDEAELDYTDFAESQRERLQGDALADELAFWQRRLADLPVLELPADRPRPTGRGHRGATLIREFPPELRAMAESLAAGHGASMFMVLAAAFNVVLSRYTGLRDVPIGVPMLGRPEPRLESVVGMFINMVVLRSDLSGDPEFGELIERIADGVMDLYDHHEVPFTQVVDAVRPDRDAGRNPLFQVSFQLLGESTSGENLRLPEVTAELVPLESLTSRFDVSVNVSDDGSRLRADVEYSTDMFDRWRIEAMLTHLETVVRVVAADPSLRLSRIPIVAGAEADRLLAAGRGAVVEYGAEPLHVAVAAVARRQPDAVAVICGDAELSYREFDRRADRLARDLRSRGLSHGHVVAVAIDRSLDAYVALLGVAKAGGTVLMLDADRSGLAALLDDAAASLVVTRAALADRLPDAAGRTLVLIDTGEPPATPDTPLEEWAAADTPAYVHYVPGPDDRPAGVVVTHRAVASFCAGYRHALGLGPGDRLPQRHALTGDLAQGEVWTGLLTGATLVATPPEGADDRPGLYGPAEAVIACAEDDGSGADPRIVRPLANRRLYVVDHALNLVPRGVTGELLIGGEPGVLAEGYLGRPALTAERFVDDPFHPGGRAFRSGRLARWDAGLRLEPLGPPATAPGPVAAEPEEEDHRDAAPHTPTEETIVGIFGEVLGLPGVSADDSFFDIGGNSLKAMLAVSRIKKTFGIKLSVRTLYGAATVRTVAAVVDERKAGEPV